MKKHSVYLLSRSLHNNKLILNFLFKFGYSDSLFAIFHLFMCLANNMQLML